LAENVTNMDGRVIFKEYVDPNPESVYTLHMDTQEMGDSVDKVDRLCIDGLDSAAPGENCYACISIEGAKMKVKLDTGAQTCVML